MQRFLVIAITLSIVTLGTSAFAEEEPLTKERGFEIGGRTGYGLPLGNTDDDNKMSEAISGQVPIWLDVGYRINPNLFVGGYFIYAPTFLKNTESRDCQASGASCSARDVRIGAQVHMHFAPAQKFDPWAGVGIGYEVLTLRTSLGSREQTASGSGFEFLNLQAGGDIRIDPSIGLGPFLSLSVGQFSTASESRSGFGVNDRSDSRSIEKKAMHMWFVLGVRGVFTI